MDTGPPAVAPVFVGRDVELRELTTRLDNVPRLNGDLYLLVGEPGVGKTRLAEAVTEQARERGFLCLWGRCWEDGGAPPYWPWVQVLRSYARQRDPDDLGPTLAPFLTHVAQLVPQLEPPRARAPDTPNDQAEEARFILFDAMSTVLRAVAAIDPLLVVLDDLHAADHDSLRLLQFLARDLRDARILVLGTYREHEAEERDTAGVLTEMATSGHVLPLRGLAEAEVAEYIERIHPGAPAGSLAPPVHRATLGNPFFVDAVTRLLAAEDRLEDVADEGEAVVTLPPSVRDAILQRLERLDDEARRALQVASVFGRSFTVSLLAELVSQSTPAVIETLRAPIGSRLVLADEVGRYRFSHMLIRDTLYGELTVPDRVRLHEAAGEVLERAHGQQAPEHLSEIAHHFLQAAPGGGVDRAVMYAGRAADHAMDGAGYEEAANLYARALTALDLSRRPDELRRCHLLLSLGAARTRAGETADGRHAFLEAAALARDLDAADELATAALGYAGRTGYHFTGRIDATLVSLLEEALDALPPADSNQRVRLLARLAVALYWSGQDARRVELSEQAVASAERLDEPGTLALALHSRRYAQWSPDAPEQRLEDATRSAELALDAGALELAVSARRWRLTDLLELGDIAAVDRELQAHAQLADRLRQPFHQAHTTQFRAMRAIMRGSFSAGESLARDALEQAERAGSQLALGTFATQVFPAWRQQARRAELADVVDAGYQQMPPHTATLGGRALLAVELGRPEQAGILLDRVARDGFRTLRRDMMFLQGLAMLAAVCRTLDDRRRARKLHELLAPFAGRIVVGGVPAGACWGPVDHWLGLVAACAGDLELAVGHFEAAIDASVRLGAPPLVADSCYEYGQVLLSRGSPAQRDHAHRLLGQARTTAVELGMARLIDGIDELQAPDRPTGTAAAARVPVTGLRGMRRQGSTWSVETTQATLQVPDAPGLSCLAALVQTPGRERHVLEVAATAELGDIGSPSRSDRGGASTTERARAAVEDALDAAITHLREADPDLGEHLDHAVTVGVFCAYRGPG